MSRVPPLVRSAARRAAIAAMAACIMLSSALAFAGGSSVFAPDRGKFKIMVNGMQAGEETFDLSPDGDHWVAHGVTEIQTSAGHERVTGNLLLHPDGTPTIAILDNNLYDQFGVLARLYNWRGGGEQTFPVLIPQALTPGSVTLNSLGPQDAGGGKKLDELQVKTADLEVDLYLDGKKLMRIVSPSANAEIDRE